MTPTPLTTVNAQFDRMFSDIPQPVTLEEAAQEAVEGLFSDSHNDNYRN